MTKVRFNISWPGPALSSNTRQHWSKRSKATKGYRHEAAIMARKAGANGTIIEFTYHPPDMRRRDAQNMPHMLKAAIDGIADAMGRDDSNFRCIFPSKFAEVVKGGQIVVTVTSEITEIPLTGTIR